jgi:hypothetical protein
MAGLTAKGLDALGMPMLAIANECMNVSISDPVVGALVIGTGETLGVHPLGRSPAAFHLAPRSHRRRCRPHNRCVGAGEATGGAIVGAAWFEKTVDHRACRLGRQVRELMLRPIKGPKPDEAKEEEEREQEQKAMKGHQGPGCLK